MIRLMKPSDRAFVANSWLRSYEWSRDSGGLSRQAYWQSHGPMVDAILDRSRVDVFCDPEDEWHVLGWVCYEPEVLHFVYVKTGMRDNKFPEASKPRIANRLCMLAQISDDGLIGGKVTMFKSYTFRTLAWTRYMLRNHIYGLEYNPRLREATNG